MNQTATRLWLTSGRVLARTHYDSRTTYCCRARAQAHRSVAARGDTLAAALPAIHAAYGSLKCRCAACSARTRPSPRHDAAPGAVEPYALVDASSLLGSRGARSIELGEGDLLYIRRVVARSSLGPWWRSPRSQPRGRRRGGHAPSSYPRLLDDSSLSACALRPGAPHSPWPPSCMPRSLPSIRRRVHSLHSSMPHARAALRQPAAPLASSTGVAEGGTNDQVRAAFAPLGRALRLGLEHSVHLRQRIGEYAASVAICL